VIIALLLYFRLPIEHLMDPKDTKGPVGVRDSIHPPSIIGLLLQGLQGA